MSGISAATPAAASGYPSHLPPGTHIDWSGLYLGLHAGYGWTHQDTGYGNKIDIDGWLVGGHVGVQRQFDRWVFGIEASFSGPDMGGSTSVVDPVVGPMDIKATVSDLFLLTARVGYTWRDLLLFVKGGYASADVDLKLDTPVGSFASGSRLHGWTVGIGFDRKITQNVSWGLEYNYIDLGANTFDFGGGGGGIGIAALAAAPYCPPSARLDPDPIHTVMARLTFQLGGEPEHTPYK